MPRCGKNISLNRQLLLGAFALALVSPAEVSAHDSGKKLQADPFAFNAKVNQCDPVNYPLYPRGANIVTSAWLGGMGLPDDGSLNSQNPFPAGAGPNPKDPHTGLLLNKNGPTWECASAGATIKGWKSGNTISELGFDYRNGGHCGAGAPRFNITSVTGASYFAACYYGAASLAPQDPEWARIVFNLTSGVVHISTANPLALPFVFGPTGTQVKSISIVDDEGTDFAGPLPTDTEGVGLAVIDNFNIGGAFITSGQGIEPESDDDDHHH